MVWVTMLELEHRVIAKIREDTSWELHEVSQKLDAIITGAIKIDMSLKQIFERVAPQQEDSLKKKGYLIYDLPEGLAIMKDRFRYEFLVESEQEARNLYDRVISEVGNVFASVRIISTLQTEISGV